MNEIVIQRHRFDLVKNRLRDFSQKTEAELEISRVDTEGGFLGLGDHKVTGEELNGRLEAIQKNFIAINETNNNIIKEFGEICNALDALDKEYIASIVANVIAVEKTSNDVRVQQGILKQHNDKLAQQQNELDLHQVEIEKNVANISKVVAALKIFKEKLENFRHLSDVDRIWNDCQNWNKEMEELSTSISDVSTICEKNVRAIHNVEELLESKTEQLSARLYDQENHIEKLLSSNHKLEGIAHLKDIDEMWDSLSNAHTSLEFISANLNLVIRNIEDQRKDIDEAFAIIQSITQYEHLHDIDMLWNMSVNYSQKLAVLSKQSKQTMEVAINNRSDIDTLTVYKDKLATIVHLKDIDLLWDLAESYSKQIVELQLRSEEAKSLIQQNKDLANQAITAEKENTASVLKQLNRKMKYVYWIAGGSITLALAELLFLLLR